MSSSYKVSKCIFCLLRVSLGILSLGLTNLHILTFTVLGMAVRVKFYCVLICQVSRNLRILFLRQILNLLSSLSQSRPGQARAECSSDEFYFISPAVVRSQLLVAIKAAVSCWELGSPLWTHLLSRRCQPKAWLWLHLYRTQVSLCTVYSVTRTGLC